MRPAGPLRPRRTLCLLLACCAGASHGLELRPTTLQLQPGQNQAELWLVNDQPQPWQGRILIHQWDQSSGRDRLHPTTAIVASPALAHLPAGARQRVRLVLPAALPDAAEQAFRVLVEPSDRRLPRYSLPLFISPQRTVASALSAQLGTRGATPCLQLHNPGSHRARLQDLAFVAPGGARQPLQPGLSGYVLPGATVCWTLPERADAYVGGRFQARRDGTAAEDLGPIAAGASAGL
jgi:fimbrial chaperone protein